MLKIVLLVQLCFFSWTSYAKTQVLGTYHLFKSDLEAYGKIEGTVWYAVLDKPYSVKKVKIKLERSPDDHFDEPAFTVAESDDVSFYIRGISLKEGPVKEYKITKADPEVENENGTCTYSTSPMEKPNLPTETDRWPDNHEMVIKCDDKTYSSHRYHHDNGYLSPVVSWAGDLNHDGLPDLVIYHNPLEKSGASYIYFSEKKNGVFRYYRVGVLSYPGC